MFLRSLSLENIRGIDALELPFAEGKANRAWTLLVGENGVGKSTVLRAAALVLAGSDTLPRLLRDIDGWISHGKKAGAIEAQVQTKRGGLRQVRLELTRGQSFADLVSRNHASLTALDAALAHTARSYFVVGYGASRRHRSAEAGATVIPAAPEGSVRAGSVASLFSADSELIPLTRWALTEDHRSNGEGLGVVAEALDGLLPGVRFHGVDRKRGRLMFEANGKRLAFEELSDGYQSMAAWCGDLLYRITTTFEDHRAPLASRGLLLLDEIDLHLHPTWQRRLREFIRSTLPNMQVLCTSHSALTAQQCGPGEVYALQRNKKRVELAAYGGDPSKLLVQQVLASDLFGLATLRSREVEEWVDERASLGKLRSPTKTQRARLAAITEALRDIPTHGIPPEHAALLELANRLAGEAAAGQVHRAKRRSR